MKDISKQKYLIVVPILLFWATYSRTLFFGFFRDDFGLVSLSFHEAIYNWTTDFYIFRPLYYLSFPVLGLISKSAFFNHLISLILYTVAMYLGYRLIESFGIRKKSALVILTIWAFSPWNIETISWICTRHYIFVYIFTFLAIISFLKKKYFRSISSQLFALLFNVNAIFTSIFFSIKLLIKKKFNTLTFFLLGLSIYSIIEISSLFSHPTQASGSGLEYELGGTILVVLDYIFKYFEGIFLQIVPVPFFVGYWHFFLYIGFLILLILSISIQWKKILTDRWALSLFLLSSLMGSINPGGTLLGLPFMFLVITANQIIKINSKALFSLSLILLLAFNFTAIIIVQENYNTGIQRLQNRPDDPFAQDNPFYANKYYQIRRNFLIKSVNRIKAMF